jgi:hypothetical protein
MPALARTSGSIDVELEHIMNESAGEENCAVFGARDRFTGRSILITGKAEAAGG